MKKGMKVTLNLKAVTCGVFQKQKRTTTNSRQYPVLQLTPNQIDLGKLTPTLPSSAHNSHQSIFPIFVVHKVPKISESIL